MKKKQLLKYCDELREKYQKQFIWLWEWGIAIEWESTNKHFPDVLMCVDIQEYIRRATIYVHDPALDATKEEIELIFLHELGHIFISDMLMVLDTKQRNKLDAEIEILCWNFAKSFVDVR